MNVLLFHHFLFLAIIFPGKGKTNFQHHQKNHKKKKADSQEPTSFFG
jgi:hypothetical protein